MTRDEFVASGRIGLCQSAFVIVSQVVHAGEPQRSTIDQENELR